MRKPCYSHFSKQQNLEASVMWFWLKSQGQIKEVVESPSMAKESH